ncbi:MAG TPA: hypothetical protein VL614_11290 [Acetobacteraceae bacterium]|nr:hypothetical protein [Acetobacteraceae bacterium]
MEIGGVAVKVFLHPSPWAMAVSVSAIDRDGTLIDVVLSEHRDLAAARTFFRSAKTVNGVTPDLVTTVAMMLPPERSKLSSAGGCGIVRVATSTTELTRTIGASRGMSADAGTEEQRVSGTSLPMSALHF